MSEILERLGLTKDQVAKLLKTNKKALKEKVKKEAKQAQAKPEFPDSFYQIKKQILQACKNKQLTGFEIAERIGVSKAQVDKVINGLRIPIYQFTKHPVKNAKTRSYKSDGKIFLVAEDTVQPEKVFKSEVKKQHALKAMQFCNGNLRTVTEIAKELNLSCSATRIALSENNVPFILTQEEGRAPVRKYLSDGKKFLKN